MSYKKDGFVPPDDPDGFTDYVCFCGKIPDLPEYRAALNAAVTGLGKWIAWQKGGVGTDRATRAARAVADILLDTYSIGDDCMCGNCNGNSGGCLCQLTAAIDLQNQLTIEINGIGTDIPPDNPGQNLPPVSSDDPLVTAERDKFLCDWSKLYVDQIFSAAYQVQVQNCNGAAANEIEVSDVVGLFAAGLGIAAVFAAPPVAVVLAKAGAFVAVTSFVPKVLGISFSPGGDDPCENGVPQLIDPVLSLAYGCQLWGALLNGFNYPQWKTAFEDANDAAIVYYVAEGMSTAAATQKDADIRNDVLTPFMVNGDLFQSFIESMNSALLNPYYEPSLCDDCFECDAAPGINLWSDPRIESIDPAPVLSNGDTQASWAAPWDTITITFTETTCFNGIGCTLVRAGSLPSAVDVIAGGKTRRENTGNSGNGSFGVSFTDDGTRCIGRTIVFKAPNPTQGSQPLTLWNVASNNGIGVSEFNPLG